MSTQYNRIAGRSVERIAALSDGLFAIAMTIIVLELHVPPIEEIHSEADLWNALVTLAPRFITYFMSFLTLGIFWVGQQAQLSQLERADRNLTWLQLGFLLAVSVMPFSTSLLAEFITFRLALLVYWATIFVLGAMLYIARRYASRAGLVKADVSKPTWDALERRIIQAQALYFIGLLLCLINTYWSIAFIVLVQINYSLLPWLTRLYDLTFGRGKTQLE